MSGGRRLMILAAIAMIAAVLAGLHVLGSPLHQRALRMDDQRVAALSAIAANIHRYWARTNALPADLDTLHVEASVPTDPVTGKPYMYARLTVNDYHLCANFDVAFEEGRALDVPHMVVPGGSAWKHPAGRYCFHFTAESLAAPLD